MPPLTGSSTTVVDHAAALSNLRTRLNMAVGTATRAVFVGPEPSPGMVVKVLHDLCEEVDSVYDALRPFAYPADAPLVRLLAVSVALELIDQGDTNGAMKALVDAASRPGLKAVS